MTRPPRHVAASAVAAVGHNGSSSAAVDHPDDSEEPNDEIDEAVEEGDADPEVPVVTAPAGSRLAHVAKAAALKAERTMIEGALREVHWNRRRAADHLGVSYKTLLNKIKECGIGRA